MMAKKHGKLIALYGINNLGKSTQARMLVDALIEGGHPAEYRKYALYDLEPSGPIINAYLRGGNPHSLSAREYQFIHVLNRTQADQELREMLEQGVSVVVEDYVETGIAWGVAAGVDQDLLTTLNSHLVCPDVGLLFEGERFLESKETNHRHEEDDDLMRKVAQVHYDLSLQHGWPVVNANQHREKVHADVWRIVEPFFS